MSIVMQNTSLIAYQETYTTPHESINEHLFNGYVLPQWILFSRE